MNRSVEPGFAGGVGRWIEVLLLAMVASVCLLLFFFPRRPEDLRALTTDARRFEQTGRRDVFPGSGMMLGLAYGCMEVDGVPVEFYADFAVRGLWPKEWFDSVRVWMAGDDYARLAYCTAAADTPMRIRVYRVDVLDCQGRWRGYVAAHPHGAGGWAAAGALTAILAMVLFVKRLFYDS